MKAFFCCGKYLWIIYLFQKLVCGMINLGVEGIDNMKISTSILDCQDRLKGVSKLNGTSTSYIHIDAMDGKFVPGLQFQDIEEVIKINQVAEKKLDVHLMMADPSAYIKELDNMNIEFITIHLEIDKDIKEIFSQIRGFGYKVGLSIKPGTDVKEVEPYLNDVDLVLVMSVEPGLGGQKFMDSTVKRISQLKELIDKSGRDVVIEVDGGINDETILKLDGADIAVVGSYIVKSDNYQERIDSLIS